MPRAKAAGCAFAMHEQLSTAAIDGMLLNFAGVMRYVVQQSKFGVRQNLGKRATHQMRDDLPIGERAIGGGTHRAQIISPQFGMNRGAGELAIRDVAIPLNYHTLQIIRADLMAETPRSAMNAYDDIVFLQSHRFGRHGIENLRDPLDFQIVIA